MLAFFFFCMQDERFPQDFPGSGRIDCPSEEWLIIEVDSSEPALKAYDLPMFLQSPMGKFHWLPL
jgi:hypothetical protein